MVFESRFSLNRFSGGHSEKAIPDPIPNSVVKLLCADGTARFSLWESRTLPGIFDKPSGEFPQGAFFCLFFAGGLPPRPRGNGSFLIFPHSVFFFIRPNNFILSFFFPSLHLQEGR